MLRSYASFLVVLSIAGCTSQPAQKPAISPEKPKVESELAFATISKKAVVSLQIQTQAATLKDVHEHLALTGWIMAKPGKEVTLTAPTSGYVYFLKNKNVPVAGESVSADQELLQLDPVLSPVEQIQVAALKRSIETELIKAQTTLKIADSDLARISDLHKQKLKSDQELEQAQKAREHAREELAGAKDKLTLFQTHSITLRAPQAGNVLQLHAGPGQYVPVSAPLITIIDLKPIWIRVPIPEYDLPLVDPKQSVRISWKNANSTTTDKPLFLNARPTGRVAQVDPNKHTADFWYEVEADQNTERVVKDLMMSVHVPIGKKQKGTVLPYSAIIFDVHGYAWIYLDRTGEKDSKHKYERKRVEVVTSIDDGLLIRPSLTDGERVVINGAAALFSREFHKTPVSIPGEDD